MLVDYMLILFLCMVFIGLAVLIVILGANMIHTKIAERKRIAESDEREKNS